MSSSFHGTLFGNTNLNIFTKLMTETQKKHTSLKNQYTLIRSVQNLKCPPLWIRLSFSEIRIIGEVKRL